MRASGQIANKARRTHRLGLIVNPIAGMGGPSAQKGTDSPVALTRAQELGVCPRAAERAGRALSKLLPIASRIVVVAAAGKMGSDIARQLGFSVEIVGEEHNVTTAEHTRAAARDLSGAGLDLLLFAGGDGTARDIFAANPEATMLGVPTGVKMHSAVFAASPEAAGHVAVAFLRRPGSVRWREAEIMDVDEVELGSGRTAARLFGYAHSPAERHLMQNCKTRSGEDDAPALEALANCIVAEMDPHTVYVLGCGETVRRIKRRLGAEGTLLGVDVAIAGRLIATDVDEARLLRLTRQAPTRVIVSVTGGQGFLFGRGNQQISAALLKRLGRDNVTIVTGQKKLTNLDPPCLRVDTGDPEVDVMLAGYIRVRTAPRRSMMMRVAA